MITVNWFVQRPRNIALRADSFPCSRIVLIICFACSEVIVFQQKVLKMTERQFNCSIISKFNYFPI